ncbi:PqiC family protein [Actibacterium sp. D379-3]
MILRHILPAAGLALLAACSSAPPTLYPVDAAQSDLRLRTSLSGVLVKPIELPEYAAAEEIAVEVEGGAIRPSRNELWADIPERAATLQVARQLDQILTAIVASDPWPFVGVPDAEVDIRVDRFIAGHDGVFRLSGQYFVGGVGRVYPERAASFDIAVPVAAGQGLPGVADAQATALLRLSEDIARTLAR